MKVSFIGLGIMGSRMAANLLKNGVELTVFNRDKSKSIPLQKMGANVADSLTEAASEAEVLITMLATPEAVHEVAFGTHGICKHMKPNALWVDVTTVSPADARQNAEGAKQAGLRFLEAPVIGTKQPAEHGELVFFVGGDSTDLDAITPLLEVLGKKTVHMGEHGRGASIKILINLMLAQSMLAFSETVSLGDKMGLDRKLVHQILTGTPVVAPFLQNILGKLEEKDESPNFPLQWMHKDLNLVSSTAYENSAFMPMASMAKELFALAKAQGWGVKDFSSIYHVFNH